MADLDHRSDVRVLPALRGSPLDGPEAAARIARFTTENCDDFGADVDFMFDKKIAAELNKMMVEKLRSKAQSTLDAFLV
jgi:hypothetical protein